MSARDLAASVRQAVDEALARRLDEHARRRSIRRADRTRRAAARDAGLARRHERKLRMTSERQQPSTPAGRPYATRDDHESDHTP